MRENHSDTAAHTPSGVSFPGRKKILTKKDGITAKKRVSGGVCCCMTFKKASVSASESNERTADFIWRVHFNQLKWLRVLPE
jgi:hypothetical protein